MSVKRKTSEVLFYFLTSQDVPSCALWTGNKERYPRLAALARKYVSAPMASIASEREFRVAKRVTDNPGALKPSNAQLPILIGACICF